MFSVDISFECKTNDNMACGLRDDQGDMARGCCKEKTVDSAAKSNSYHDVDKEEGSLQVDVRNEKAGAKYADIFDTKTKKFIIISISVYSFIMSSAYSMLAPFFPGEASKKDTKSAVVGLIFAVFPLVIIVLSPLIGLLIPIVGTKFILSLGLILEGGSQIIFGFLDLMPNTTTFVTYSFIIRIVSGIGAATTSTASLTLLSQTFQDNIAPAMGIMELFAGLGLMAGPPIGGFLYEAGGFLLPFLLFGLIALASLIPLYYVLPADKTHDYSASSGAKSFLNLLKIPAILVIAIAIALGGVVLSFLDPTLEAHLKKPFHLTSSQIGLMFLVGPAAYAIMSPPCGIIANKVSKRVLIVIGAVICGLSYVLLGPAPFLPKKLFPSSLWLNGVSLTLLGFGGAMFLVPSLADMNSSALTYGLTDSIATQSALSSIYTSMFYIGNNPVWLYLVFYGTKWGIVGPVLAGFLVEHFDFPWSSAMLGFLLFFVAFVIGIFTIVERRSAKFISSRFHNSKDSAIENEEIRLIITHQKLENHNYVQI